MTTTISGTTGLQANRLLGTTTNDDAIAGQVGEYLSSTVASGAAISLSNGTYGNMTSITLTPGDWDVSGYLLFLPVTGPIHGIWASLSTTSSTLGSGGQFSVCAPAPAGYTSALSTPMVRFSVTSNTTVYLVVRAVFSGGSCTSWGGLTARRVR